ncbi:helix-turn-helix transcriptional regulator [Qipengyuania oceanensis]|nr:helix-turn-helix transcriptional regulator [Qipengyuania oceanensis]
MTDLLGMRSGQLVAFGRDSLVPLNMMTRVGEDAAAEFVAIDGGNPAVNSKVHVGLQRPELMTLDEADFDTAGDRRRSPEFAGWMDRHDIGYCCVSTLIRTDATLVGLAAIQSANGPGLNDEGKRAFEHIAGAARSAVLLREAIEGQGLKLLTPALDSVGLAVAICDITGRIRAMTPSAENLVASQSFGRMVDGRFAPHDRIARTAFENGLSRTIQSWAIPFPAGLERCVLKSPDLNSVAVEFLRMPAEHAFSFSAAAMVVFKLPDKNRARRKAELATVLLGLTKTEREVAEKLLCGWSPGKISTAMGTSVGTVRNHVHRILQKADCRSQVELLALMSTMD